MVSQSAFAADLLTFDKLYLASGVLGLKFSDTTQNARNKQIRMRGFMAPPLKPNSNFFVLNKEPVALCAFCSSDADWPMDIVVVYTKNNLSPVDFSEKIEVEGRLELGSQVDEKTGFVSQIRIMEAVFKRL